jgi:hypothetical protein
MIKKYWWIFLIILFLGIFLTLTKPKKGEDSRISKPPITSIPDLQKVDEVYPETLRQVGGVNWSSEIRDIFPRELEKITIKKKVITEEREKEIINYLGISPQNGYIQKDFNYIQFTNMPENVASLPTGSGWDIDRNQNKVRKIIGDLNQERDIEINWTRPVYRKYKQPYMMETSQDQAQFLEISGDYVLDGKKLTTFHGESFSAYFDARGNLLKLSVYLKPRIIKRGGTWSLLSLEEAKKSPARNYRAGVNDLYGDINKVNITQTELVVIFDNTKETIAPYFLLEGNTISQHEQKPVNITVLLGAEK